MNMTHRRYWAIFYQRIYRGVDGLLAPFRHVDDSAAARTLSPAGLVLFRRMSKADQAHSLRVYRWLQENGYEQEALLQAGLLHDCGKAAARLAVWQRTLKVLMKSLSPAWWRKLSAPAPPDSWRHPFYVLATHAQIGAQWAQEAGCSELTCWLIAHHESTVPRQHSRYSLLRALQYADGAS